MKQKQKETVCFGFGRVIFSDCGCCWGRDVKVSFCDAGPGPGFGLGFLVGLVCSSSSKPSLSTSVSRLVRSSIGPALGRRGPGLLRADKLACALCCQQ